MKVREGKEERFFFFKGEKHERQNIRTGTTMAQSKEVPDKRKKKKTLKDAIIKKYFIFQLCLAYFFAVQMA